MKEFIRYLKSNEWNVELYEKPLTDEKVKSALSLYTFVSGNYLEFLKTVKRCINKDETVCTEIKFLQKKNKIMSS